MKRLIKVTLVIVSMLLMISMLSGCMTVAIVSALSKLLSDEVQPATTVPVIPQEKKPLPSGSGLVTTGSVPAEDADWTLKNLWAHDPSIQRDEYGHALNDFSEVAYTMPDTDKIESEISRLEKMAEEGTETEAFLSLYEETLIDYSIAETQLSLVQVVSDLNINDKQVSEDKIKLTGKVNEYYDQLLRLSEKALDASFGRAVLERWGEEYADDIRREARNTSEEIQPLIKELAELEDAYDSLSTNHTVDVNGEALTIEELAERGDLGIKYYTYLRTYYETLNEKAGELFLKMVKLNNECARLLNYDNFADYQYACFNRDYSPDDSEKLAEAVKKYLVPLHVKLQTGSSELISRGESASTTIEESIEALRKILPYISSDMASAAEFMLNQHLYDFSDDSHKTEGGYTTDFGYYGVPYINYKSNRSYNNVTTVFHEFGHFYNAYCNPGSVWNKTTDLDLAEIHSQGLELILQMYYSEIYGPNEAEAVKVSNLSNMIWTVLSGCMEDEFQQKLYAEPEDTLTVARLNEIYTGLMEEYQLYAGYFLSNDFWGLTWVAIPHTFEAPFYYISYATSLLAALEIWEISEEDPTKAIDMYLKVQSHNAYDPFRKTLSECSLADPFEVETIRKLTETLSAFFEKKE